MRILLVLASLLVLAGCETMDLSSVTVSTYHPVNHHSHIRYTLGYYHGHYYNGYRVYGDYGHRYYYAPHGYRHHRHYTRPRTVVHNHYYNPPRHRHHDRREHRREHRNDRRHDRRHDRDDDRDHRRDRRDRRHHKK